MKGDVLDRRRAVSDTMDLVGDKNCVFGRGVNVSRDVSTFLSIGDVHLLVGVRSSLAGMLVM